jgi:NADH-quinone oxidoreductase subunit N
MEIPKLSSDFYQSILAIVLLSFGALVHLIQACLKHEFKAQNKVASLQILFLILSFVSLYFAPHNNYFLSGTIDNSFYALQASMLIVFVSIVVSLFFWNTYQKIFFFKPEISCIYLISISGLLVLVSSQDIVSIFIGIEMSSIGLYALVGYTLVDRISLEGALKYLILGALSTGLFLFAVGLIYASCKSFNLDIIRQMLPLVSGSLWLKLGVLMLLVSLGFKLSLVPFHMWSPDVYQSAPSGITAFMATNVKVAIIVLLLKLIDSGFFIIGDSWIHGLYILAVLSILFGNLLAITQTSLKRILAYSSIAHSGYMVIALCAFSLATVDVPYAFLLFYLLGYCVSSLLAFGCLMLLESRHICDLQLSDIKGLCWKHPWVAISLAVSLISFAGLPPTVGFMSKFFIFSAAIKENFIFLVVVGVLGSVISVYYYLRIVVYMFMNDIDENSKKALAPVAIGKLAYGLLAALVFLSIGLGTVLPETAMSFLNPNKRNIQTSIVEKNNFRNMATTTVVNK